MQNYGGNRQLNSVLYIVALSHLRWDPKGKAYFEKKVQEGKTKKHAIRCLMSRIACIVYAMLKSGDAYRG
jgi:transposase